VAWGDYDNDGDLDLLITGTDANNTPISKLYRCSGGANPTFVDVGAGLTAVTASSVAWGDYDNDGDLDILLTGQIGASVPVSKLYGNGGGANPTFSDVNAGLAGVYNSSVAWGDYDNDGDLDILLTGRDASMNPISKLYRNGGGANPVFTDVAAGLTGVGFSSAAWGDFDNDGYLDIVLTGRDASMSQVSKLYRNSGGANPVFTDVGAGLIGVDTSSLAWGDYDNDGDLDLLMTGTDGVTGISKLYRNDIAIPNTPPAAPSGLIATSGPSGTTFSWSAASDAQTPTAGLCYNLRVGTTPGGDEICSAMAAANGYRRVARLGNAQERTSWTVALPPGPCYWSVQAIDGAFQGSVFAAGPTVAVDETQELPSIFDLDPPAPNPFSSEVELTFALPRGGPVEIAVFDLAGRRLRVLEQGRRPAGRHRVVWDGSDEAGAKLANGIYLIRMNAAEHTWTRKLVLAR
jgi:hypothetical protein